MRLFFLFVILIIGTKCSLNLYMSGSNAQQFETSSVILNGEITQQYKSQIYQNPIICTNGLLKIVQFNATKSQQQFIEFTYSQGYDFSDSQINITVQPNESPLPILKQKPQQGKFILLSGCQKNQQKITTQNYYNRIKISLNSLNQSSYQFSFLINCDRHNRHKKFQYGYMIIGLINAAITIGVALHSRIWSIKYKDTTLRFQLTWKLFLLIMLILMVIGATFYLLSYKQFKLANEVIKYLGLAVAFVFTFICFNQILFLFRPFKKVILNNSCYNIRICQIASISSALILFIISLFVQNWILYTFLAGCICVGSIKMLYFSSMKQAFYSLAISVCSVTLIAIILHFTLPRSYNDYASELSSPLFIEVPDLVNNLFKKCSWLPVIDIIVPGVFLSFLRTYDQNFNTGWGGVYTIIGNSSFLLATMLWIGIQALYPFSVPFSLITYTFLLLSICVIAFKRNELKTLWGGYFLQQRDLSSGVLRQDQTKKSFADHMDEDTMNAIRIRDSLSSKGDQDEGRQLGDDRIDQPLNPQVSKSAFRTKRQTNQINGQNRNSRTIQSGSNNKNNIFTSSIR